MHCFLNSCLGVWKCGDTQSFMFDTVYITPQLKVQTKNKYPNTVMVYKCALANLMLGITLQWTSIPSRGE